MNKKGQVLVAFILLIPLILMFLGIVLDVGATLINDYRIKTVVKNAISYGLQNKEEIRSSVLEEIINKNIDDYESLDVIIDSEKIEIKISKINKSVFESILNIGLNKINVDLVGDIDTGSITRR